MHNELMAKKPITEKVLTKAEKKSKVKGNSLYKNLKNVELSSNIFNAGS